MFVTRKTLDRLLNEREKYIDREVDRLRERYWDLNRRHDNLLAYLKLTEEKIPERIKLQIKGGPEKGK